MSNTVTNTRIILGERRIVQYVVIDSDGTEETDLVIYDSSAVATALGKQDTLDCSILEIQYSSNAVAGIVHLEFDATTDVLAWALPVARDSHSDFRAYGGLNNTAGTGKTGDITLTTTGLAAGDKVTLVIQVRPN